MDNELINIFDENYNHVGIAPRDEVHQKGYWHEAFHCWFVKIEDDTEYIYLQIRSPQKKDYPNLLDITAAGHLLANETIEDGVREVKEELGIDVYFEELVPVGVLKYSETIGGIIDNEFANVFLYYSNNTFDDYQLQKEEVSGIVRVKLDDLQALWLGGKKEVTVQGFELNAVGEKVSIEKTVSKRGFLQYEETYYKAIINGINPLIQINDDRG
ncbi:NUDIX hydrolase [Pseudalkalibacillus decolorationis]|uniref:NUDIX hydrolase n=1 Tax=Pseudalkalibacillus decolorationis TaxID=163879 RepID=UPI0021478E75|nr:NUDIX domain-containing protein [Pseudalkalibacillus decolorationis]